MPDDVARLVLGTAGLGQPYGLPAPGRPVPELIPEQQAHLVVEAALAAGITTFDTAPAYGEAEARLGAALSGRGSVWTKVGGGDGLGAEAARRSLGDSLRRLRRGRLGLLSWHNWSGALLERTPFREAWDALRDEAAADAYGATTYGAADALAAVESGLFAVVQVEWNLLQQAALRAVAAPARERGVRLALRSVFLQGVLSPKGQALPAALSGLAHEVSRAAQMGLARGLSLAPFALRAALQQPADFVLIGVDSGEQLHESLAAVGAAALDDEALLEIRGLDRAGDPLVDPRRWPQP